MKIVYIAHPIGGDVQGNIKKVEAIAREINLTTKDVVPFVPYHLDLAILNDSVPEERQRGMTNNFSFFSRGTIDEVWLFGDRISPGMEAEIALAESLHIPVIDKTFEAYQNSENGK